MQNNLQYLNAMRAFEAAARHESFAAAAKEMNVSHSVVSRHVRQLELRYNVQLFARSGNHVELSETGRALFSEISMAFRSLRDANEKFSARAHDRKIRLKVSAEPAIATRWLRRHLTAYCAEHTQIDIELLPTWQAQNSAEAHVDLAIQFAGRLPDVKTGEELLLPVYGYPCCAPHLLDEKQNTETFEALMLTLPLVHDNGRRIWQMWFSNHLPDCELWEHGKVYTDFSLAIGAAVDGEGIILADEIICGPEIKNGSLVRLDDRGVTCTNYMITQLAEQTSFHASEALKRWLIQTAQDDVGLGTGSIDLPSAPRFID